MTKLKIPERQLAILQSLVNLNEEEIKILIAAIERTPPTLDPSAFFRNVAANAKGIKSAELEAMIETLCGLYYLKEARHLTVSEIVDSVSDAAKETEADFQQLLNSRETLAARLSALLKLEKSLGVAAKAINIMTSYERVFIDARILSDIRPIFTSSAEAASAGFVVHNLSIKYRQGGASKEFFIALDTSDLRKLMDAITRAEKKTAVLETVFKKAEIPYLDAK